MFIKQEIMDFPRFYKLKMNFVIQMSELFYMNHLKFSLEKNIHIKLIYEVLDQLIINYFIEFFHGIISMKEITEQIW